MTNELLPCPFCGDAPMQDRIEPHKHLIAALPDYPGSWSIECIKCEFRIFDHDSHENAVAAWNRRANLGVVAEPVAGEQFGYRVRRLDPNEGPSAWRFADKDDAEICKRYAESYEVQPLYASPPTG